MRICRISALCHPNCYQSWLISNSIGWITLDALPNNLHPTPDQSWAQMLTYKIIEEIELWCFYLKCGLQISVMLIWWWMSEHDLKEILIHILKMLSLLSKSGLIIMTIQLHALGKRLWFDHEIIKRRNFRAEPAKWLQLDIWAFQRWSISLVFIFSPQSWIKWHAVIKHPEPRSWEAATSICVFKNLQRIQRSSQAIEIFNFANGFPKSLNAAREVP